MSSYTITNVSDVEPDVPLVDLGKTVDIVGAGHSTPTRFTEGPWSTTEVSEVDHSRLRYGR